MAKISKNDCTAHGQGQSLKTVIFKIHGGWPPLIILQLLEKICNWNNLLATYYIFINIHEYNTKK